MEKIIDFFGNLEPTTQGIICIVCMAYGIYQISKTGPDIG